MDKSSIKIRARMRDIMTLTISKAGAKPAPNLSMMMRLVRILHLLAPLKSTIRGSKWTTTTNQGNIMR